MADHFPPDSMVRRVGTEPALLLGAGRALLLQLAHPAVAQGVQDHSDFKRNPFKRLEGTLEATYAVVFGSESLAQGVGRRIRRMHDYVTGPAYRANDPENLLWVHATLVDTALGCQRDFVGPLRPEQEEAYYQEMTRVAEVFGVPRDAQPADLDAFRVYFDETVASLEVTEVGRELGRFILRPELPARLDLPFAPLLALLRLVTVATLPDRMRAAYGLAWDAAIETRFEHVRGAIRAVNRATPRPLRTAPTAATIQVLLRQARQHVQEFDERERRRAAAA